MTLNFQYLFHYLEKIGIVYDKSEFLYQLNSHPDYPSLLSISDTLTFFKVDNAAIKVDFSEFNMLPNFFITLLKNQKSQSDLCYFERKNDSFYYIENKTKISITKQELEQRWYGGPEMMKISEIIFNLDSRNVINEILSKEFEKNIVHVAMVLKIKFYLDFFKFSLTDMILFCDNNLMNFSHEFEYNSDCKTLFNKEYDQIRAYILDFQYQTFFSNHNFENDFNAVLIKNKISINNYVSLLVHMSCNRHFDNNQRYSEFKTYFFTKRYINYLKHSNET